MSTRSGLIRTSYTDSSPPKLRKGVSPQRSPRRPRKSSPPAQSPSRKSPARKSPSRKPASKFPARKSPSRATKETTATSPKKSPTKRPTVKSNVEIRLEDVTKLQGLRSRARRTEYTIKDFSSVLTTNENSAGDKLNGVIDLTSDSYDLRSRKSEDTASRRSSRLKEFIDAAADIKRSVSKSSVSKSISQSIDKYSDEDDSDEILKGKSKSTRRKLATPPKGVGRVAKISEIGSRWEFGGRVGSAALIALLPLTAFCILIACTKNCSVKSLGDLSVFKAASLWFSPIALAAISAQYVIQALFACLPILGTKADRMDDSGRKQTFNAFFSSIFTVALLFALDHFNIFDSNTLLKDFVKLAVSSYIFAVVLSIVLYLKSRKLDDSELNPYGNTGYLIYDFWMGREIHPHLKKLDVKIWISRICNINALVLSLLIFKHGFQFPSIVTENQSVQNYQEILTKVQYKPTILLYCMMQMIYVLNFIVKEHKITTTFYWQSEGVGYLQAVSSALYPFYFTTISKFVAESQISLSTNTLIAASIIYVVGLLLMLISNNIKHEFRKNPLHPSLTHLDSMPTFHGKKLLVSHLWGILRHPNYTGDILVHLPLALPGIVSREPLVAAPAIFTILALLYRAYRDNSRCRRRYGAAWQRYCKKVQSVILPKIL